MNFDVMKHVSLARGRSIAVLLDLDKKGPISYTVLVAQNGWVQWLNEYVDRDRAYDLAEEFELCFAGPHGDTGLKATLDRAFLRDRPPGQWQNSPAELAARFFNIGTWNWLVTTIRHRNKLTVESGKHAQ